jgi:hypothetical protein
MIVHKTFTRQTAGLTGKAALANRERLRQEVERFISETINEHDVINITESAITVGGLFSITTWYRESA